MACGFIAAGFGHFLAPKALERIVPPGFGDPYIAVALSGVAEIVLGAALLVPRLRRYAALGLGVLLLCVWPANWYMALRADLFRDIAPAAVWWLRVPFQILFLAGVGRIYREAKAHE